MTRTRNLLGGLLGATALTALSAPAFAANNYTPADTTVSNVFTLSYSTGSTTTTVTNDGTGTNDDPTTFEVDRLINLTVSGSTTTGVLPGEADAEVVFTVVNNGNDAHDYLLEIENETGDDFDTTVGTTHISFYYEADESNADGVCEAPGTATVSTYNLDASFGASTLPNLAADAVLCVIVQRDMAATATNGQDADISLVARTLDAGTLNQATQSATNGEDTVENVLADAGGTFTGDGTTDGDHSATSTYVISAATVTGSKAVAVLSETGANCATGTATPPATNNQKFIPGACVEYTITAVNGGGSDATALTISDTLDASLELVAAFADGFTGTTTITYDGSGTAPGAASPTSCNGPAAVSPVCVVSLSAAELSDGDTGTLRIRAFVK